VRFGINPDDYKTIKNIKEFKSLVFKPTYKKGPKKSLCDSIMSCGRHEDESSFEECSSCSDAGCDLDFDNSVDETD
tara:strand:- start:2110 stop:2337 length:228 start_codon:yes stop_codon:yes gene_type:complete